MPQDPTRPEADRPQADRPQADRPGDALRGAADADLAAPFAVGIEEVVTLAQETATITKQVRERGVVRVRTVTELEDHVERAALEFQTAEVTRHPVNRFVDSMPAARDDGDLMILPVVEERLVVEKRLFVTEEIHIRRVRSTEQVELPVSLRRQHAVVERLASESATRDEP